jgi:hypothetical protein
MGGEGAEGVSHPRSFPPPGTSLSTSEAHQIGSDQVVQVSTWSDPIWRATWHLREAAPTMGGKKQRGKQKPS